jgi:hypothetical protein
MGAVYVPISKTEMHNVLTAGGFTEVKVDGTYEAVYERKFNSVPRLAIRVYTSICEGSSRGCGEDAIRVTLVDTVLQRGVGKAGRTNRVHGWQTRIRSKINQVFHSATKLPRCPCCKNYMQERKGGFGTFFGCCLYPQCNGTRKIS